MKIAFHVVYTVLALNFLIPAAFYAVDPAGALHQFTTIGAAFGGGPYTHSEDSVLWRVLAVATVATLGFCCVLLQTNLRRWYPVLVPLAFLKGTAAAGFGVAFVCERYPGFLAAFALDAATVTAIVFFAVQARRALNPVVHGRAQ